MSVVRKYAARNKYRCDICGHEDFWQSTWVRLSSIGHDEECPDEMPTVCGPACKSELDARLKDGRIALPKLRLTAGGFRVSKPRRGY